MLEGERTFRFDQRHNDQPSLTMANGSDESFPMNQKPLEDSESEGARFQNSISDDGRSTKLRDDSDEIENGSGGTNPHIPFFFWKDPHIWRPPEPADMMERFASDDDDNWNDNEEWGRSNFGSNHNNKEERQTAPKWRLKTFIGRLLASEGVSFSEREGGESWLEIVASLSWETALLLKHEYSEGNGMGPLFPVKVTCVASGARQERSLICSCVIFIFHA